MSQRPFHLTFDIDWAPDDALQDVLDRLEANACQATFFVTHDSPLIRDMASVRWVERGLHPNFNPLLFPGASGTARSAGEALAPLCALVPEATSARSHSLVRGTPILGLLAERGIRLDSSDYLPPAAAPLLELHRSWTGVWVAPFCWSDYMDVLKGGSPDPLELLGSASPLRIAAFHPIHVALNCTSLGDYERAKADGLEHWRRHRRPPGSGGVGDRLDQLLAALKAQDLPTGLLRDLHRDG